MKATDPNVQLIEATVEKLVEIAESFVFVGGSTTGLLITDMARAPVRATVDVHVLTETTSMVEYQKLGERLRWAGFREDRAVLCRWLHGPLILDVVPTDPAALGFSNRWYVTDYKSIICGFSSDRSRMSQRGSTFHAFGYFRIFFHQKSIFSGKHFL